jgi:sulfur carrier protein
MLSITANGKVFEVQNGLSVADFIRWRGLDPRHVVVERNGEAVERRLYEEVRLSEGDRLELVRAVAGGK